MSVVNIHFPVSRSTLRWVKLGRQCVSVTRHLRLYFIQNQKENVKDFTFTGSHVRFNSVSGETRAAIRSRCVVANVLTRVASWETFIYICVVQKLKLFVFKDHFNYLLEIDQLNEKQRRYGVYKCLKEYLGIVFHRRADGIHGYKCRCNSLVCCGKVDRIQQEEWFCSGWPHTLENTHSRLKEGKYVNFTYLLLITICRGSWWPNATLFLTTLSFPNVIFYRFCHRLEA